MIKKSLLAVWVICLVAIGSLSGRYATQITIIEHEAYPHCTLVWWRDQLYLYDTPLSPLYQTPINREPVDPRGFKVLFGKPRHPDDIIGANAECYYHDQSTLYVKYGSELWAYIHDIDGNTITIQLDYKQDTCQFIGCFSDKNYVYYPDTTTTVARVKAVPTSDYYDFFFSQEDRDKRGTFVPEEEYL